MNVFLRYFLIIGFAIILVGCGTSDDDSKKEDTEKIETTEVIDKEEIEEPEKPEEPEEKKEPAEPKETMLNEEEIEDLFTEFNAATEEVEIYDVDMELIVELTEGADKTVQKAELFGTLEESMVNIDMTAIETQGVNKNEMHLYKAADDVYIQENGASWVKATETNNEYSQSDTSYGNVAKSLDNIKHIVEVDETEDTYEVKYAGNGNVEIFKAFEEPFSLSLTGVAIEEAKMDVLFLIDKESKTIEDIRFELTAEKDGVDLMLTVEIEYEDFNDTQVEIPDDVIGEAI